MSDNRKANLGLPPSSPHLQDQMGTGAREKGPTGAALGSGQKRGTQ